MLLLFHLKLGIKHIILLCTNFYGDIILLTLWFLICIWENSSIWLDVYIQFNNIVIWYVVRSWMNIFKTYWRISYADVHILWARRLVYDVFLSWARFLMYYRLFLSWLEFNFEKHWRSYCVFQNKIWFGQKNYLKGCWNHCSIFVNSSGLGFNIWFCVVFTVETFVSL